MQNSSEPETVPNYSGQQKCYKPQFGGNNNATGVVNNAISIVYDKLDGSQFVLVPTPGPSLCAGGERVSTKPGDLFINELPAKQGHPSLCAGRGRGWVHG
jgi:hypothetical protein